MTPCIDQSTGTADTIQSVARWRVTAGPLDNRRSCGLSIACRTSQTAEPRCGVNNVFGADSNSALTPSGRCPILELERVCCVT